MLRRRGFPLLCLLISPQDEAKCMQAQARIAQFCALGGFPLYGTKLVCFGTITGNRTIRTKGPFVFSIEPSLYFRCLTILPLGKVRRTYSTVLLYTSVPSFVCNPKRRRKSAMEKYSASAPEANAPNSIRGQKDQDD